MSWLTALTDRLNIPTPSILVGVSVIVGIAMLIGWTPWVLLLAVLAPIIVLLARRPQIGVLLFVAAVPFDGLRASGRLPPVVDGWKQATILVLLLLTFVCPSAARATGRRRLPGWVPAFAALASIGIISAALVGGTTAMIGMRISFFDALIAVVIWRCPFSRKERDDLISILLAVAIFVSLVGIAQQLVGHEFLRRVGYQYDETIRFAANFRLRAFSTFNQPFPFAFYLMLVVLMVTPFALSEPKRLRSKIFFISIPLIAQGIISSYVRAAVLGLAVGLLYLAFHRYKLLVYGIPLVIVAALLLPSGSSFTRAFTNSDSLSARTSSWDTRFEQFLDAPMGSGLGTTGAAAEKLAKLRHQDEKAIYQPDNSYLKWAFELGILGLWLFVAMLVSMFLFARDVERRSVDPERHMAAGFCALLLAIMVSSTVATYFEMVPAIQLFWVMTGLVATMAPREVEETPAIDLLRAPTA